MDLILHLHSVICFIGYLFLWSNILVQRFLFIRLSGFGTMHLSRCISSNTNFDDPFFCVICSLHLSLYTAAWVTFNGVGSNRACCLLQLSPQNASCSSFSLASHFFLSLSQSTFLGSSLLFVIPYEASDRVHFRARPFARQWSFAGGRSCVCLFRFQFFLCVSILMRWPG